MRRLTRVVSWVVLAVAPGLAGCHVTAKAPREAGSKAEAGSASAPTHPGGHGREDRAFGAPLRPTLTAVLGALDDAGVRPERLIIHGASGADGGKAPALAIEPAEANLAMLPAGDRAEAVFARHEIALDGGTPTPFVPIFVSYKGKAADGRAVDVTIATRRGDESNNLVAVKVGHRGDAAWSGDLLGKVGARLGPGAALAPPPAAPGLP